MLCPLESKGCPEACDPNIFDDENREDILISGSKKKPVTHIRAKASRLLTPLDWLTQAMIWAENKTYVKMEKRTKSAQSSHE
jgi:hypothetical protein